MNDEVITRSASPSCMHAFLHTPMHSLSFLHTFLPELMLQNHTSPSKMFMHMKHCIQSVFVTDATTHMPCVWLLINTWSCMTESDVNEGNHTYATMPNMCDACLLILDSITVHISNSTINVQESGGTHSQWWCLPQCFAQARWAFLTGRGFKMQVCLPRMRLPAANRTSVSMQGHTLTIAEGGMTNI